MMFLPDRALARVMSICGHSQMFTVYCFLCTEQNFPANLFLMYTAVDVFGEHIHRYNADDLTLSVDCILRHITQHLQQNYIHFASVPSMMLNLH